MEGQQIHIENHARLERKLDSLIDGQTRLIERVAILESRSNFSAAMWGTVRGGILGFIAAIAPRMF